MPDARTRDVPAALDATAVDRVVRAEHGRVVALYDQLYAVEPSPVVALNRSVAVAERDGPVAGLAALNAVPGRAALEQYVPLHATEAELLRRCGNVVGAHAAYERALALATNPAQRRHLEGRRTSLA